MKQYTKPYIQIIIVIVMFIFCFSPHNVNAHCDTLDGPVVTDAKLALEKGDISLVLKWIKKEYEEEIREAYKKTMKVRTRGAEVKALADMYFFETLVRLHRTGEGAPYTGLKPAGMVEPPVAAADKALESGSVNELVDAITKHISDGIRKRFAHVVETKQHANKNVEAGRKYIKAYVEFTHYIERIHQAAIGKTNHHEH